jgi:malonate transporter and related proteins
MIDFALLCLPIFGVVGLGWIAAQAGLATPQVFDALGAFSFRFALPALVFRMISSQPLDRSFNVVFYSGYLASGSLIFALVFGLTRMLGKQGAATAGAHATTATVSNLGFLGPPLALAFFGERGAGPLAMAILAEIMVLLSLGGAIIGASRGSSTGMASLLLRGTALNPVVAAIVVGAAFAATRVPLPPPIDRFFAFLGNSAGPTALFAVGGALAVQRIDRKMAIVAAWITAVKLIAYPLLVWYLLARVLQLESFWVQVAVLLASLPSAGSNYVLAQRYAANEDQVSAAIVLSTVVSVATVPITAWVVRH